MLDMHIGWFGEILYKRSKILNIKFSVYMLISSDFHILNELHLVTFPIYFLTNYSE